MDIRGMDSESTDAAAVVVDVAVAVAVATVLLLLLLWFVLLLLLLSLVVELLPLLDVAVAIVVTVSLVFIALLLPAVLLNCWCLTVHYIYRPSLLYIYFLLNLHTVTVSPFVYVLLICAVLTILQRVNRLYAD